MFGYRCDKCGAPINIDPNEERICDVCMARMQHKESAVKIIYQERKREARHAG